jgi:hypothetical protein
VNLKTWFLYAGNENQQINSFNAAFLHTQQVSTSRYEKRKDCIVFLECQLALFLRTSSFGTICEEPHLRRATSVWILIVLSKNVGLWGVGYDSLSSWLLVFSKSLSDKHLCSYLLKVTDEVKRSLWRNA